MPKHCAFTSDGSRFAMHTQTQHCGVFCCTVSSDQMLIVQLCPLLERFQHPQAAIGEKKQRKAKNGVDDRHHRMDGNALRRPSETCSRSGAM